MATVDKDIADRVIAGEFPEDGWVKIVKYTNMAGEDAYGLVGEHDDPDKYRPSPWITNPTTYWEKK